MSLTKAEAASTAAQARIVELQKALADHQSADEARRARDAEIQAQLTERNRQIQVQLTAAGREFESELAASNHDFESRFATHAQAMARFEKDLTEARDRNTEYLEALQSVEGRRSVFEDLISNLEDDVSQRDTRISALEKHLNRHTGHENELESELRERIARIAALDKQVSALTAALAQRVEQHTDGERTRAGMQQSISALNGTLAERNDRVKVLEGTVEQHTIACRAVARRVGAGCGRTYAARGRCCVTRGRVEISDRAR